MKNEWFSKNEKNYYYHKPSELQPVEVQHDPRPDHNLKMYPFNSEESIQWHLLRHGFADYWVNPQDPNILSDLNNSTRNAIWKEFINIVKCPRWCIDFPGKSENEAKNQWQKALNIWTKIPGEARIVSGCNQCRKKNSDKQFRTCYDFYKEYRSIFLKKIKAWIIETIQDNNCLYFYKIPQSS